MSGRKVTCATGVDLDRAVADDRMSVGDADEVRAFARFVAAAPRPRRGGYTREELVQLRAAYVELGGHDDVVAKIDGLLG